MSTSTRESTALQRPLRVEGAHDLYNYHLPDWVKIRDCVEGERRVKEQAELYLPRLSTRQSDKAYLRYKSRARFIGATARTKDGFTGAIFRKAPTITLPDALTEASWDIDLAGCTVEELVQEVTEEAVTIGRAGVLVDHEADPSGRAYLLLYKAEEITQWGTSLVNGRRVLSLVELRYEVDDVTAEGKVVCIEERRCLRLLDGVYTQIVQRYQEGDTKQSGGWVEVARIVPMIRGMVLDYIPFVFVGPKNTKPEIAKSPLLSIAEINLHHYQGSADWRLGLFLSCCPTPYSINLKTMDDDGAIELGPGAFHEFQGDSGSIGFLEPSGSGLSLIRDDLKDLKEEMALLGAAFLTPPKREAETAEALTLKSSAANSPLAKICQAVERGLTQALSWWVEWMGGDSSAVEVRLNKDFDKTKLSPDDLLKLSQALQDGAITAETYAYLLSEAEMLPPDLTPEDYAKQLEQDKADRQAKADAISGRAQGMAPQDTPPAMPPTPNPAPNGSPIYPG